VMMRVATGRSRTAARREAMLKEGNECVEGKKRVCCRGIEGKNGLFCLMTLQCRSGVNQATDLTACRNIITRTPKKRVSWLKL
jgi:hypothetical protein